jgi:DNA-directed RNA polymerase subunit RPC12/RpoP
MATSAERMRAHRERQRRGTQGRHLAFCSKPVAVPSLRIMPEEKATVLCPSCKSRMSITRKITQAMSEDARKFIYHCAMCDIEIRQSAPQRSNAPVEANASIRDPRFAA